MLALIHASPYARYFGHEVLGEGVDPPAAVGLFTLGWSLMTIAMVVTSALPVVAGGRLGGAASGARGEPRGLTWTGSHAWLAGALGPWLLFGFAFAAADLVVHSVAAPAYPLLVARLPALSWLAAGGYHLLWIAVVPRTVAATRASVTSSPRAALIRGWREGLACLGQGWVLMLAVASQHGQLGVMIGATVVMSATPSPRVPRWLNYAVGVIMVAVGLRLLIGGR